MRKSIFIKYTFIVTTLILLTFLFGCKPINIFSPLVDPSKMGNEAKLDAGYNALESGDYDKAIDYFTSVINSSSGEEKAEAYIGRASAYLESSAPNLDDVVDDLINGDLDSSSTGDIIDQVVGDNEYDDFFDGAQNAADDYNNAVDELGASNVDPGILLEAYQANMMAATGVGAQKIVIGYNVSPWDGVTKTLNEEYDAVVDSSSTHPYNISTWSDSNSANNGLYQYVKPDATASSEMMNYLENAFEACEALKNNPPQGMTVDSINDMENGIKEWAYYGLGNDDLGIPQ